MATDLPATRGGARPKTAPVGWAFLAQPGADGITVRWCRGETVAYVLDGPRIGDHATVTGVLGTIPSHRPAGPTSPRFDYSGSAGYADAKPRPRTRGSHDHRAIDCVTNLR